MSSIEQLKELAREQFDLHNSKSENTTYFSKGQTLDYLDDLDQIVTSTYLQAVEDCAKITQVHEEGEDLGYCDTGADMEMGCRSKCVEMALNRLRKHYQSLKQNKD